MLKICRKPVTFDDALEKTAHQLLLPILLGHIIFAVYIYGNDNLFEISSVLSDSIIESIKGWNISEVIKNVVIRAFHQHNIALSSIFILYIFGYVFY